jgi:hypothetical protein
MIVCAMMVLGGLTTFAGTVVGDVSGNDGFLSAEAITPGFHTGNVTDSGGMDYEDYYCFTMSAGQYFNVVFNVTALSEAQFKIYNPAQSYIDGSGTIAAGAPGFALQYTLGQADAGTYYFYVAGGPANYSINFTVSDQFDAGQLGDAGDTLITARTITPGTYVGWAADLDEDDYYKFEIPNGGKLNVTFTTGTSHLEQAKLTLYKPDGNYLNSTTWLNPGLSSSIRHTTADNTGGIYGLLAETQGNNYTININITMQDDVGSGGDISGDINTAHLVPGNGTYSGYVADDDEDDYVKFNVTGGQRFYLTLMVGMSEPEQCKLTVYKPDKNYLDSTSWTNAGMTDAINYTTNNAVGGQYYILLEGVNSYSFTILLEDQFDAGIIGDAGDDISAPRPIELNKWYNGWEADADQKDYYSFPCMANQKLTVNFTVLTGTNTGKVTVYNNAKTYIESSSWVNSGLVTYVNVTQPTAGTGYLLVETDFANYTFNISAPPDSEPPVLTISTPAQNAGFVSANITVTGTATDNVGVVGVEWSLNNMTWANCTGTGTWSVNVTLVAGGNTVYVRAVDGNNNWAYANRQFYLDTQAPAVTIATPVNGTSLTVNTVTVTGTATDNMLIAKIEVQLGTGSWVTANGTTAWTLANLTLTQGSNTITVRATDTAGNSNTTQTTVTVDSQAPAVSVGSPTEGAKLTKDKVKLSGTASDNVRLSSIEVTVNGVAVTVTGLNIWYVNITLKEGKNNITVTATDGAGLKTSQTLSVTYTKPKPQPGFELVFLIGAVAIGLVMLGRKRN